MRNAYGQTYGQQTLPVKAWQDEFGIDNFSTNLSDVIAFGADFRTRIIYRASDHNTSFIETQGDLYFDAKVNKKLSVYLDKGISTGMEVFGLARVLPMKGYMKIGRFTSAYGIRLDDRNNRAEDTGFELGLAPGDMTLSAGIFNGPADDRLKTFATRADIRHEFGELKTSIGGSLYRQPSAANDLRLLSAFGGASYMNLTVFGEADFRRDVTTSATEDALLSYIEADYLLTSGLDLKFIYEFFDPNVHLKTGSNSAYTIGFEFFPMAGLEVKPLYRIQRERPVELQNDEFHLLCHVYL